MLSVLALCAVSLSLPAPPLKLLVFSKTAGFRHDSIPAGQEMIRAICAKEGWVARFTEDAEWFQPNLLKTFDVTVFLCTTQDVLNDAQQAAFQTWFEAGKGYVGIHSAADTEYDWPWYGELAGAWFSGHPRIQQATIRVENRAHPTTKHLPADWVRTDEWYNYRANPRGKVQVLATLDESTYEGGTMGKDHPIIWCRELGKGRTWYTGLGHTKESYSEAAFVTLIAEALRWVGRRSEPQ